MNITRTEVLLIAALGGLAMCSHSRAAESFRLPQKTVVVATVAGGTVTYTVPKEVKVHWQAGSNTAIELSTKGHEKKVRLVIGF